MSQRQRYTTRTTCRGSEVKSFVRAEAENGRQQERCRDFIGCVKVESSLLPTSIELKTGDGCVESALVNHASRDRTNAARRRHPGPLQPPLPQNYHPIRYSYLLTKPHPTLPCSLPCSMVWLFFPVLVSHTLYLHLHMVYSSAHADLYQFIIFACSINAGGGTRPVG